MNEKGETRWDVGMEGRESEQLAGSERRGGARRPWATRRGVRVSPEGAGSAGGAGGTSGVGEYLGAAAEHGLELGVLPGEGAQRGVVQRAPHV